MCRRHNPYSTVVECADAVLGAPQAVAKSTTPDSESANTPLTYNQDMNASSASREAALRSQPLAQSSISSGIQSDDVITAPSVPPVPFEGTAIDSLYRKFGQKPFDAGCLEGATLTVYNGDISQHFEVASQAIRITRGALKYAQYHERFGSHTRFRFQLCNKFMQGTCEKLSECMYIHAATLPKPSTVHLNPFAPRRLAADRLGHSDEVPFSVQDDPLVAEAYETLPPGFTVTVYPPNDADGAESVPQSIPSDKIILTAGAVTARRSHGGRVAHKARHCAHFQYKRLCHLGAQCHFIHSKIPLHAPQAKQQTKQWAPPQFEEHLPTDRAPYATEEDMCSALQYHYHQQQQYERYASNPAHRRYNASLYYNDGRSSMPCDLATQMYQSTGIIFPPPGMALPRAAPPIRSGGGWMP